MISAAPKGFSTASNAACSQRASPEHRLRVPKMSLIRHGRRFDTGGDLHFIQGKRKMSRIIIRSLFILLFISAASVCDSRTIHVKQDGSGDYDSIELAVSLAVSGDTVLVWLGHYHELVPPDAMLITVPIHLISHDGPLVTIINNISFEYDGGQIAVFGETSYPVISNNIISRNVISFGGGSGIFCNSDCPPEHLTVHCNDLWNNAPPGNYAGIPDLTGIDGNISTDPLFCDAIGSGNYYLQAASPCAAQNAPGSCDNERMGCCPVGCEVDTEEES